MTFGLMKIVNRVTQEKCISLKLFQEGLQSGIFVYAKHMPVDNIHIWSYGFLWLFLTLEKESLVF